MSRDERIDWLTVSLDIEIIERGKSRKVARGGRWLARVGWSLGRVLERGTVIGSEAGELIYHLIVAKLPLSLMMMMIANSNNM